MLLLGVGSAFGQLGATVEQAAERFGAPVEPPSLTPPEPLPPNVVVRQYRVNSRMIDAWFLEGVICRIRYSQPQPFSAGEVDALLSDNAENAQWIVEPTKLNPARVVLGIRTWRRSDQGAAVLTPGSKDSGKVTTFDFSNRDWLALQRSLESDPKPAAAR